MFEDSLMESAGRIRTNQRWSMPLSFLVQALVVGVAVLIPLIITEGLPTRMLMAAITAPPPPPPPPPPPAPKIEHVARVSEIVDGALRTPSKIPKKVSMITEDEAPPPSTGVVGGLISATAPPPKGASPMVLRFTGGVAAGNKIEGSDPPYPAMARIAHVQ